ncbi:MAG: SUMF1/EgtB/PvdO family nonheme iron enzyme [Candidatus Acidiferrales bacterium]
MTASHVVTKQEPTLLSRLDGARAHTDALFALLPPNSYYERPIAERHRLIFYLGHLEAFDRNLLNAALGIASEDSPFDKLFAFGIDPVGGGLPTDQPGDWPEIAQVERYNHQVRTRLDERLRDPSITRALAASPEIGTLLQVAIEHRLMHAETLAYLFHNLPVQKKIPQPAPAADARPAPDPKQITIPSGIATLGQARESHAFGWDNEFVVQQVLVPSFTIGAFPVTNSDFLKFVQAGGYQTGKYWRTDDWQWLRKQRIEHPHFWKLLGEAGLDDPATRWEFCAMFGAIPLPPSWPVYVSHAEASAYSKWAGKKLPTEEQWHRAAYGTPEGRERAYPWGDESPDFWRGNFNHDRWDPAAVDAHPEGASAFGVCDLLGNGWEWTSTVFGPLPGFQPFELYRGYSADFFDGKHFVMKGGSVRTDVCMLRRSFRNWFQPHYPYIYSSFRCVEE